MNDTIESVLNENEKIIWRGKPKFLPFVLASLFVSLFGLIWLIFLIPFAFTPFFFFLPHLWIGIFLLFGGPLYSLLVWKYMDYAITDKRVIIRSGVIGRDFKMVDFDKITTGDI